MKILNALIYVFPFTLHLITQTAVFTIVSLCIGSVASFFDG